MAEFVGDIVGFIRAQSLESFVRIFWLFIFTDLPRYFLMDIYIFVHEFWFKKPTQEQNNFVAYLRNSPPLVSVIIPTLNEADTLRWTIRSLEEQSYKNLQLIVVDDGSTDGTAQLCSNLKAIYPNIKIYRMAERSGKAAALNCGLQFAEGEFVVFVDSDTTFDRDAIINILTPFYDPQVGGISGNLLPRNGSQNLLTTLQHIEYLFVISIGRRVRGRFNILPIISGAFGAFRSNLVNSERLGGHEPGPGNDSDMTIRLRKLGYRIVFAPNAYCLTNVPSSLYNLLKQRARWDRNIIKNRIRKHKDVYNPFSKNFRSRDVLSFIDTTFFHVVLGMVTVLYILDIAIAYPEFLVFVLIINLGLYLIAEIIELFIAVGLSKRWDDLGLVIFLPLFNPFKILLKFNRVLAYFQELTFRSSNRDPFSPAKVRSNLIRW